MSKQSTNKLVKFLALFSCSGFLLLTLVFPSSAIAAFTEQINYQGKLTNSAGASVTDGNYSIAFTLYTASSGGSIVWTETQTVAVVNGLFSTMLGSVSSLSAVNFNQALYLSINVNGDGEMTPRKTLGAVSNAFNATKLDGLATSSFLRSDITNATGTITNLNSQYLTVGGTLDVLGTSTFNVGGGSYLSLTSGDLLGLGSIPFLTGRADTDAILGSDLNILGVADRLWIKETDGLSDIGLSFYDNSLASVAGFSVATSTKYFTFSDANSWSFRSTGSGNDPLTINTANSSVSIGTSTNLTNSFYVKATSTFEGLSSFMGAASFTNDVSFPQLFIDSGNGGIGIGTTTPGDFSFVVANTSNFTKDTVFNGNISNSPYHSNIRIVGGENVRMPSSARNVFVSGHYAYVMSYPGPSGSHGLRIIDISNPENPKNTGELELPLPNAIGSRVRVVGSYAYISFFADTSGGPPNAGFRIVDVSDPYNPRLLSGEGISSSIGNEHACMEVSGHYMYLCSDEGGLEVVDIIDPYNPRVVKTMTGLPTKPWDIKINKGKLYYGTHATGTDMLRILDISNPHNPTVIGGSSLDFGDNMIWSMDYANDYLYLAMGWEFGEPAGATHFRIVDVSSSTNPLIVGGQNLFFGEGTANYVKVAGNRAYISQWNSQFSIIDIASSTNPQFIAETASNTYGSNTIISFDFYGKYIVAGYSYFPWPDANYHNFRILDATGLEVGAANIGVIESELLNVTKNASIQGLLSVAGSIRSGIGGLFTEGALNVLSTTTPSYFAGNVGIGTTTGSYLLDIQGTGDLFNVTSANGKSYLRSSVFTANIGQTILLSGQSDTESVLGSDVPGVSVAGFVNIFDTYGSGYSQLSLSTMIGNDLATSTEIRFDGQDLTFTGAESYTWLGGENDESLMFASSSNGQLNIVGPSSFELVANNLSLPTSMRGMHINDGYLYASFYGTSSTNSFRIIDISNPANPRVVGGENITNLPHAATKRVYASGNYAYLTYDTGTSTDNFRIIDITDKSNPKVVDDFSFDSELGGGPGEPLYVQGKHAILLGAEIGNKSRLRVVDISTPSTPKIVGRLNGLPDGAWDVKTSGDYAYACFHDSEIPFVIINIKDKANPYVVSTSSVDNINTDCWSVEYSGSRVYLGLGQFGNTDNGVTFRVLDVSDPSNPIVLSGEDEDFNGVSVQAINYMKLMGDKLYMMTWGGYLHKFDISSSTNPVRERSYSVIEGTGGASTPLTFDIAGNYVFTGYAPIPTSGASTNYLRVYSLPGINSEGGFFSSLFAGLLKVGNEAIFDRRVSIGDSLLVSSGGIMSEGALSITGTTTSSYFAGSLGIGTTSPMAELTVVGDARFQTGATSSLSISEFSLGGVISGPLLTGFADTAGLLGVDVNYLGFADRVLILEQDGLSDLSLTFSANDGTTGASFTVATTTQAFIFGNALTWTFEDPDTSSSTLKIDIGNNQVSLDSLSINGAVYSNNGVLTNVNPSSRDYKDNILDATLNVDALLGLQVKTFDWKTNGQSDFGLIAEEIGAVLPELYVDNGQIKGYRADHLPFYLLQIAQRQAKQITELDNRIASGTIAVATSTDTLNLAAIQSIAGNWSISADGTIVAKTIKTDQLCLGNTCLDEEDLKSLLDKANILITTPVFIETPIGDSGTTTEPVPLPLETSSSTEPIVENTAQEPEPTEPNSPPTTPDPISPDTPVSTETPTI